MTYRICQVGAAGNRRRCHAGALSGGKRQAMISPLSFRRKGGGVAHCKYGRKSVRPLIRW